jgi:Zn-dependent peptidase ImmA (M78 family)
VRNDFNDEISGVLVRRPGDIVIGVESSQSPERQRFTIAHELGHLVLHDVGEVHVDKVNYRSSLSSTAEDVEEVEANAFAAALLMPRAFVVADLRGQTVNIEDEGQVTRLANRYLVSTQAMTYRLINIFRIR